MAKQMYLLSKDVAMPTGAVLDYWEIELILSSVSVLLVAASSNLCGPGYT
jgi:hypothetical protein